MANGLSALIYSGHYGGSRLGGEPPGRVIGYLRHYFAVFIEHCGGAWQHQIRCLDESGRCRLLVLYRHDSMTGAYYYQPLPREKEAIMLEISVDWHHRFLQVSDSPHRDRASFEWTVRLGSFSFSFTKGERMALTLSSIQGVQLTVVPVDAKGNPAPIDGVVAWSTSDESVLSVAAASDGLTAEVRAVAVGHAQITASADARLGPEVVEITGVLEIDVVPAEAVTMALSAGEPFTA